jgi:transcriptional regulator with XRE-family HTH domain
MKNATLIENLRILRRMQDYTQDYVASQLKISVVTYSQIENGKIPFTADYQKQACKIIGISLETLRTFNKDIYFQK